MPEKSQNAVLKLYSIIFLCAVSKLKPKQYKSSNKPKMAYSRDLPKMARQQCGIMD